MAHYYSDRMSFYGIEVDRFLPFNFLRDVHIQTPIVWIGLSWIDAGLFLAPAISGGEPRGQAFLVDVLFWVTLFIVVGAFAGNYLGVMGYIQEGWGSSAFYDTTLFWQWMRLPGDVVFALGALLMAWDFVVKRCLLLPHFVDRIIPGRYTPSPSISAE